MIKKSIKIDCVVNFLFWKSQQDGKKMTNKKLQKLLYYSQAWHLTLLNRPLFSNRIEAWVHGPAVREIYLQYKQFSHSPIEFVVNKKDITNLPTDSRAVLESVWRIYGNLDANYLEFLTHKEAPWQEARAGMSEAEASNNEIKHQAMQKFYVSKLKKAE